MTARKPGSGAYSGPFRQHRYSFSGADARVYSYFDGVEGDISPLDSVQTISLSIHEAKGQVRALGHRGIKGLSRGVRTIAGSLILTVINDHPLRTLLDQVPAFLASNNGYYPGWSLDRDEIGVGNALDQFDYANRMAPLIPPFNLMVNYVSEGAHFDYYTQPRHSLRQPVPDNAPPGIARFLEGANITSSGVEITSADIETRIPGASMLIKGIEFIDSGIVTSVHDIVSEMTFSFIACDVKPLSHNIFTSESAPPPEDPGFRLSDQLRNELSREIANRRGTGVEDLSDDEWFDRYIRE